jgi:hypothetical protein
VFKVLGKKCCNRTLAERLISRDIHKLPGVLGAYCRYCTGYKPLSECHGRGYNNSDMQVVDRIGQLNLMYPDNVCY